MYRYWRVAILGICRGNRALRSREGALHLVAGKVNQKPVEASSTFLLTAEPCRDHAFSPTCAVTQEHVVLTPRHLVLPAAWFCSLNCHFQCNWLWSHKHGIVASPQAGALPLAGEEGGKKHKGN